jgi:hypothetical protein
VCAAQFENHWANANIWTKDTTSYRAHNSWVMYLLVLLKALATEVMITGAACVSITTANKNNGKKRQ